MKKRAFFIFCIILFTQSILSKAKVIGLMICNNEKTLLKQALISLARYTDAIVILDDASVDGSNELIEKFKKICKIEKIIRNNSFFSDQTNNKNMLMQQGRLLGGTHFIFLYANEMISANFEKKGKLKEQIALLSVGQTLSCNYFKLLKNSYNFFHDAKALEFIFCDNQTAVFSQEQTKNNQRIPRGLQGKKKKITDLKYGVISFELANWRNYIIKQAWLRCAQRILFPKKNAQEINKKYFVDFSLLDLNTIPAYEEWYKGYNFFDPLIIDRPEKVYEKQVLEWFSRYGQQLFAELDIWNIDWGLGIR